ncbi:MAG: 4-hydroxyphenylacetate 3-hydroxylase family protein [Alphaproteobacteria bacterium]
MLLTGAQYRESLNDGREVWLDGERVRDVPRHPAFKPVVEARARIYDMAHEEATRAVMAYADPKGGEPQAVPNKPPVSKDDWRAKRRWVDAVMADLGGVILRVGDETVGGLWSLLDGRDVLDSVDPRFGANIALQVELARTQDLMTVSANTDPKGDRSKRPQEQDPDMLLHVVRETDAGIIVRGAKYETAAAYAHQAFVKPTIANWGDALLSDYAVGFVCKMNAPGLKHICRSSYAHGLNPADYPITTRLDEVDSLIVFEDVLVPWEQVLFYRHTRAAAFIRSMLHRYTGFPFLQRLERVADLLIGTAIHNARQTGLDKQQAVREKLATLVCYRESINAFLTACIELAETSPAGLAMPHQSTFYAGRTLACAKLPEMMHLARELCGGQICVTPDAAAFADPETKAWLEKYYTVNEAWKADDRRRLLAFARDLLNGTGAGHRTTFHLFAQSPPYAHLNAVYQTFDWSEPLAFVRTAAGLSDRVMKD